MDVEEVRNMTMPRIFVSHSSEDAAFANRLSNDLRSHGADVWLDSSHMASGDFIAGINQALQQRDVVILILSPAAIHSAWVTQEINAAIARSHQGLMRQPLIFVAKSCPPEEIPPLWTVYRRYDATQDYDGALKGVLQALTPNKVAAIAPAAPTVPVRTPLSPVVLYSDTLRSNANGWHTDSRIEVKTDGLHVRNVDNLFNRNKESLIAWAPTKLCDDLSDVILSVNVRLLQDNAYHGAVLLFRYQSTHYTYGFQVSSSGRWCLFRYQGPENFVYVVPWTENHAIKQGINISNAMKVSIMGTSFHIHVNNVDMGAIEDSTYLSGKVGLGAGYNAEVVFTDLVITTP
ncbi:MAG TPA: toll/interleukin-1 receptor domain-containing protein [Ktedonobacterales bacterium]|jgi:hypothetical protein